MLDSFFHRVRLGTKRLQNRGEEIAQNTRLRMEIFSLTRRLDALYTRLGRSYHTGADVKTLQQIRSDIGRVNEEISSREHLIREIRESLSDDKITKSSRSSEEASVPEDASWPTKSNTPGQ